MKVGFLINPIAGMGGSVALKGTDGEETLALALKRGAVPRAPLRAEIALREFAGAAAGHTFLVPSGKMGADLLAQYGVEHSVIYKLHDKSTAKDTVATVRIMLNAEVDLLVFAGGDGTARDVCTVVGDKVPVVGIPAGVKIHSGVYANKPKDAGTLIKNFLKGHVSSFVEAEVMDIDEEKFRNDVVAAKLFGYMLVPDDRRFMQDRKSGSSNKDSYSSDAAAAWVVDSMQEGGVYLVGSGSTTARVMKRLGLKNTLLGVDAVSNGRLLANDLTESDIKTLLESVKRDERYLVITIIGGQGHIFGRGNQQLSPDVLRMIPRDNISVLASPSKLAGLFGKPLIADTGDASLDAELSGYMQVVNGYGRITMVKVS
jgi:predicted polyphosphate/ATP-dependent NAD kinase